jgi:hypothetical protein
MRQAFMAEKNHSGNIARKGALFISASIGIGRKKAAPDNSARIVLARQRLIYYVGAVLITQTKVINPHGQPVKVFSIDGKLWVSKPSDLKEIPPNSRESHLPETVF